MLYCKEEDKSPPKEGIFFTKNRFINNNLFCLSKFKVFYDIILNNKI